MLEARGREIAQNGIILDIGSGRYRVSSQSVADAFYDVSFGPDGWRCTCRYHLYGKRRCKHIRAVCSIVMDTGRLADEVRKEVAVTEPCVTCTFCQGTDCIKRGVRRNKSCTVPRYKCNSCGHKFTHNPGFVGRHHPPEVITDVLQSYAAGTVHYQDHRLFGKEGNRRECCHRAAVGTRLRQVCWKDSKGRA